MTKRMSQQKKRQIAKPPSPGALQETLHEALFAEVQEVASRWKVLSAEHDYAGYWDGLGFRFDIAPEATAEDVLEMGNALLAFLKSSPAAAKLTGTWIIGIYRDDEMVRVIGPESKPHFICATCGYEQEAWADWCLQCKTPR